MRYLDVTYPDINSGIGFRVTVWVAGCGLCKKNCKGCHNKWTWDYNQGSFDVWDKIEEGLSKDYIKGLTLSGGDPLDQNEESLKELCDLLKKVKTQFPSKDIWLYSGFTFEEIIKDVNKKNVLKYVDVLVDGKYDENLRDTTLAFRGSKNQRIMYI